MSELLSRIDKFFEREKIEYYGVLKFSDCKVINDRKLKEFKPESAVMFLIPYKTGEYPERNVSLYSVSKDYHLYAKLLQQRLETFIEQEQGVFKIFCDSSPIDERDAALKSGLGVKGKNSLVINEKYGSFVFIGTLLTDRKFDDCEYIKEQKNTPECIGCSECISSCEYLSGKRNVCLSSLNQQKRVSDDELTLIKQNKIRWGCDVCQLVCPMNKNVQNTPIDFFYEDVVPVVTAEYLQNLQDEKFSERAYSWRGRAVIERNIGN